MNKRVNASAKKDSILLNKRIKERGTGIDIHATNRWRCASAFGAAVAREASSQECFRRLVVSLGVLRSNFFNQ